ncbi:MAG: NAD(P)/FAD-dependent oxidoreductase [Gammaproteobacteria bacterium]|nr:NAD(P)/FAD-dependent oxidoreductase [Gammaproteobacteria bacterium]
MADAARPSSYDAIVVGAGFAGLYMSHKLRELGLKTRVYEIGGGVGGTWYWNRYPGARCDIESMEYSYGFSEALQQEWEWTERYASQPEILTYANHVADRFELRDDIQLNTRVDSAHFDERANLWHIQTSDAASGEAHDSVTSKFYIMATGCLSARNTPDFKGLSDFQGPWYHTGNWPHEGVDFTGKRVAIIGTGSSAVQSIPLIAEQAGHLYVFQRTPNFSIPAHNEALDSTVQADVKSDYQGFRASQRAAVFAANLNFSEEEAMHATPEAREREYEARWQKGGLAFLGSFSDLIYSKEANDTAADFVRAKIRETVDDAAVAELLSPKSVVGCKRLCIDTNYFETYNRSNVTLIDVSDSPIEEITRSGVCVNGENYEVDSLVLATGFDAMTGALFGVDIRGRGGLPLKEKWSAGPRTYLGVSTAGFPNLFTISGPGSPSVLSNMLPSIEQHVRWISDCIEYVQNHDLAYIEATLEAEDEWVGHVNEVAGETLFPTCNSWYLGVNIPGKPRVFMPYIGGFPAYCEKCDAVADNGYEGFAVSN